MGVMTDEQKEQLRKALELRYRMMPLVVADPVAKAAEEVELIAAEEEVEE